MSTVRLHLCGITTDGELWHTSRSRNFLDLGGAWGSWSAWESVKPQGVADAGPFVSAACGARYVEDNEEIHICAVTQDGRLLYTSRVAPQDWQPFEDLKTSIQGNWDSFRVQEVTFGLSFLDLCVIVLTNSGERHILHTSLGAGGTWESFQDVNDPHAAGFPGSFISVGCANLSPELPLEELHVCGVTSDGKLWHTLYPFLVASFSWLPFADVQKLTGSNATPSHFTKVSIAQGSPDLQGRQDLHVFTQVDGDIWHTTRFSNPPPPRWQPTFGSIKKQAGDPGTFGSISCANVDGQLHVCAVSADGKLWHTNTASDSASWQSFEEVVAAGDTPPGGAFSFVSLAVIFVSPERAGENPVCQIINWNMQNARSHMQGVSPGLATELQQALLSLQQQWHDNGCI